MLGRNLIASEIFLQSWKGRELNWSLDEEKFSSRTILPGWSKDPWSQYFALGSGQIRCWRKKNQSSMLWLLPSHPSSHTPSLLFEAERNILGLKGKPEALKGVCEKHEILVYVGISQITERKPVWLQRCTAVCVSWWPQYVINQELLLKGLLNFKISHRLSRIIPVPEKTGRIHLLMLCSSIWQGGTSHVCLIFCLFVFSLFGLVFFFIWLAGLNASVTFGTCWHFYFKRIPFVEFTRWLNAGFAYIWVFLCCLLSFSSQEWLAMLSNLLQVWNP